MKTLLLLTCALLGFSACTKENIAPTDFAVIGSQMHQIPEGKRYIYKTEITFTSPYSPTIDAVGVKPISLTMTGTGAAFTYRIDVLTKECPIDKPFQVLITATTRHGESRNILYWVDGTDHGQEINNGDYEN